MTSLDLNILETTIRIDNGRLDIPVFFSICGHDAISVIGTKKQMGKGATPHQSEASALMELVERFSFFSFKKNPNNFITDTYRNLSTQSIPFERIAQSVHDNPDDHAISLKLFEEIPLKWTSGLNLTTGDEVLIPFDWFYAINEFNGPSSGNCMEEAVIQGICEVVERHVSALISRYHINVPAISIESVTDPNVIGLLDKYRRVGIRLYISDFSLGIGIPSVGVLAYDPSTFPEKSEIVWTAGTTPSPQKSLNRALTEVAQLAGDFNTSANYVASGLPKFKRIEETDYLAHSPKSVAINELPDISDVNFRIEINRCVEALAKKNLEVIVINTTQQVLQIPCCYTIIPGAHFRERAVGTGVAMFCAKLAFQNNDAKQALQELTKMERLLPDKYFISFYIASAHLSMGNPETALDFLKKSLRLNPKQEDMASIYSSIGTCLKDLGKYRDALSALNEGLQYDSERTDLYNLMGFCHYKLKEHEKAIEKFHRVLELDPSSAIDYANIASNYRDMNQKEKAIRYYELALELDPSIEFARDNLRRLGRIG
jgi:ribosomal protein S12 methylthiotransferase accessory factor